MNGTSVSTSTRTETCTEDRGQGYKSYVKTIVIETTTTADGTKTVNTTETETIKEPGASGGSSSNDEKKIKKKPQEMKDFIDEVVATHNKYRKTHPNVGDLNHNKELTVLAQTWTDHLAATKVLEHSDSTYKGKQVGENVASKWSSEGADYTGVEVVDQWYSEASKYNFVRSEFTQDAGHFTQLVWKGSREIGVGKTLTPDGRCFVVCNYSPAGNVIGQFSDNVFKAK